MIDQRYPQTALSDMDDEPQTELDATLFRPVEAQLDQAHTSIPCSKCGLWVPNTMRFCPQDGTAITPQGLGGALNDRYEFIEAVGAGGMSVIYKARHRVLDRLVAIKMLHSHMLTDNVILRFQQEAKASSSLIHPNTVGVHDFGVTENGQPYMVMDFIEGETLAHRLKIKGDLSVDDCLKIFTQVCDAVQHAHENGILHRDLKPSNIMLIESEGTPGIVKIVDFGIAKIMDAPDSEGHNLTQTGDLFGSPLYMSPEQCAGNKAVDVRSDIYSLGCVMYECLTGAVPHRGENMVGTIVKQINEQALRISELRPDKPVPEALEDVIDKALAKNPEKRFQTIQELKAALLEVRDQIADGTAGGVSKIKRMFRKSHLLRKALLPAGAITLMAAATAMTVAMFHSHPAPVAVKRESGSTDTSAPAPNKYAAAREQAKSFLAVADHKKITDVLLRKYLPFDIGITKLDLSNAPITSFGLIAVGQQKLLTDLSLPGTKIGDQGLSYLSDLTALEVLNLRQTQITNQGLKYIRGLSKLRELYLSSTKITNEGLVNLEQLNDLENLSLSYTPIYGYGLEHIKHLRLQSLHLDQTNISDRDLPVIGAMSSLTELHIGDAAITGRTLDALKGLTALEELKVSDRHFTDQGMRYLGQFPHLKEFSAIETSVTDAGFAYLPKAKTIERLYLNGDFLTDAGMKYIVELPELRKLSIRKTLVTDRGLRNIINLKKLEALDLSETKVTDASMKILEKIPSLRWLRINECKSISEEAREAFNKACPHCRMEELNESLQSVGHSKL